jgi:hypothetical protein
MALQHRFVAVVKHVAVDEGPGRDSNWDVLGTQQQQTSG